MTSNEQNNHDDNLEASIADYIAGEMDTAQRRQFETRMRNDVALDRRVRELQDTAGMLCAELPGDADARRRVADLSLPDREPRVRALRGLRYATTFVALKFAAAILLAFGAGFYARGSASTPPPAAPATAQIVPVRERLIASYTHVSQERPNSSSFSRSLLAIVHSGS